MINYFKSFFYPPVLTHRYNHSKELVVAKINEVLKNKVRLFSSNDMYGKFLDSDTFRINVHSIAYTRGVKYGSTLIGKITALNTGITEIKTVAKPSTAFYFLFFVITIFSLGFIYKSIAAGSLVFLSLSLLLFITGSLLTIGLSNVTIASIRERYVMYIDKELKQQK